MGLITDQGWPAEEYEAVALPPAHESASSLGSAVFRRRSARPTRRAVLHLHDLAGSFAPGDLVRWYNDRGFHFYVTDLDMRESLEASPRRRPAKSQRAAFAALDAACTYLRDADGIDAIILSASGSAALTAALWCDARRVSRPVDALILSSPDFGRARGRLDIACPVLVISAAGGPNQPDRRERRGRDGIRLGQHVTWLYIGDAPAASVRSAAGTAPAASVRPAAGTAPPATIRPASGAGPAADAPDPERRRLFDEMGRWLGAYMYGQVRDQLL